MTRKTVLCKVFALFILALSGNLSPVRAETTAYDFSFPALEGGTLSLSDYRGKVMMVVNTASLCGYTPQYEGLQTLWSTYRDQGFVLIGIPSGDFGGQELGSADKIKDFCETNFGIDFPMAEKLSVRGDEAHPFYRWAREVLGADQAPGWNFHKYLVDRQGRLVTSFATRVRPDAPELLEKLESLLKSGDSDGA